MVVSCARPPTVSASDMLVNRKIADVSRTYDVAGVSSTLATHLDRASTQCVVAFERAGGNNDACRVHTTRDMCFDASRWR